MVEIPGLLELSAPLARRIAPDLCRRDPATGESCAWSHGFWQYLRLMGLASTPAQHADFYRTALESVAENGGTPRVLISGTVDYCMPSLVLAAFEARGIAVDVTVVDLCETPLWLSRWYAERASHAIATRQCDMLEYTADAPFDAICTHSLLGRFAPERRFELFSKWHTLLRPGGKAITVNRVRTSAGGAPRIAFTPGQAQTFRAAVIRAAADLPATLRIDSAELERAVEDYVRSHSIYPVASRDELLQLFERAGFRVESEWGGPVDARVQQEVSGVATPGGAQYLRIVATRR